MKVVVKVKFNTSKEYFENFGGNKYLLYLPFEQDDDSANVIIHMLSRKIGASPGKIEYAGQDMNKDWVFEVL
ncbi:hypothetical protein J4217_04295 [Candidatus Pacearchaeota archaeon]|nr:hypothetical protein [Candidatus Pacearchaeota archaeon]